jgi:uncharacterized protein YegP (UPF0339 family)
MAVDGAHFEVFKDDADEWRFRLVAANGEPVAQSEGYTTEADARRGAEGMARDASDAPILDGTD